MPTPNSDILDQFLRDLVNTISRQAAKIDPDFEGKLKPLAGQVIEISCTSPAKTWHLKLGEPIIKLCSGAAVEPNAVLQGTAIELFKALSSGTGGSNIRIDGDETLLVELIAVSKNFYPDLAGPLASLLGEHKANRITALIETGIESIANFTSSLKKDIALEVNTKIAESFTSKKDFDNQLSELDDLRLRIDRLNARLSQREWAEQNRED